MESNATYTRRLLAGSRPWALSSLLGVLGLALSPLAASVGEAQVLDGDPEFWSMPLVAIESPDAAGASGRDCLVLSERTLPLDAAGVVGEGSGPTASSLDDLCGATMEFGPGGPIAQASWVSNAWAWGVDHWYVTAAPVPLGFLGGGGGGGGGGGSSMDPQSEMAGTPPGYDEERPPYYRPTPAPVPEPGAGLLFGLGFGVVAFGLRKSLQRA